MTDIHAAHATEVEVKVCPNCSSTQVDADSFGKWHCGTCKTEISEEDLIVSKFKHELGDDTNILEQLVRSLRNTVAKDLAVSMGSFLLKWGFLDSPDPYMLSRYVNSCARAMLIAIIEERQKIEREKHGN
jgi:ribosomal protein S27AE